MTAWRERNRSPSKRCAARVHRRACVRCDDRNARRWRRKTRPRRSLKPHRVRAETPRPLPQVAAHDQEEDCYIIIGNKGNGGPKVYDVTKYLEDHPGGSEVICELAGKYADDMFEDIGHSNEARKQLKEFLVGPLKARPRRARGLARPRGASIATSAGDRGGDRGARRLGRGRRRRGRRHDRAERRDAFLFGGSLTRSRAQVGVLVAVVAVGVGYYFYSLQ